MKELVGRFLSCPKDSFFLFGPRGTGKSSWLKSQIKNAFFIDLLLPETNQELINHPEKLTIIVSGHADKRTFVLDEIQRVPSLLTVIHHLIETLPDCQFIMTGSSSRKLKRAGVDMLAGRALLTHCHPFMAAELGAGFHLESALQAGLIPLILATADREAALRAYLALYIREEVQLEGLVRNMGPFIRFLETISFSHGSLLNTAEIARECAVSRPTVEGYVSILEDLLIAFRLPVFAKRAKRQLIAHSKFYFFDAGVFRSIRPKGPLDSPNEIDGAALEGLVLQHLRAWNDYSGSRHTLSFWRTQTGTEVDFIVYGENELAAIEVKNTGRLVSRDLQPLKTFASEYPEARLILLYRGTEQLLQDGILCMPCDRFLRELIPGQPLPDKKLRRA
jgi:predicted AAA+ superfamily ATPase